MAFNITKNFTVNNARQIPYVPPGASQVLIDKYFGSTTLLLQADATNTGTVVDSSTNNFTITSVGTPAQGAVSPFASSGGSEYFNGSTYLSTPSTSSFNFSTNNFTIEGWINPTSIGTSNSIIGTRTGDTSSTIQWCIYLASGFLYVDIWNTSNVRIGNWAHQSAVSVDTWNHIALVRNGSTFTIYLNGIASTTTQTSAAAIANAQLIVKLGSLPGSGISNFFGYMSNMRIVNGTALYTSAFTPSTSPLTAVTNTVLLLKFDNAKFLDSSRKFQLVPGGSAAISTSTVKYGSGSMYFPNMATDVVNISNPGSGFSFTGDFTIEAWVYQTNIGNGNLFLVNNASNNFAFNCDGATFTIGLNSLVADITSATAATNVWQHCALVRSGTAVSLYVNGTSVASVTKSGTLGYSSGIVLCRIGGGAGTKYIDDLRITNGVARYTASFTPPTAILPSNGATGGTITYSGADVIHTFTSTGTFKATTPISAAALVVAGGGSGGSRVGGGGGAGGFISQSISLSANTFPVLVGSGGSSVTANYGSPGGTSSFNGVSARGGGGGSASTAGNSPALLVGSGGGGSNSGNGAAGTVGQGFNGGNGFGEINNFAGGGGGGSGANGSNTLASAGSNNAGGTGGQGKVSSISGASVTYGGGGGGSGTGGFNNGGIAFGGALNGNGIGGGGAGGANNTTQNAIAGVANSGAGGGGGAFSGATNYPSGAGGSGIVIVRYTSTSS